MKNSDHPSLVREEGSVAILMFAFVLAFVALLAIAVDLIGFGTALQQSRNHAQLAALSALERYVATEGSETTKRNAALLRANEISATNRTIAEKQARSLTLNSSTTAHSELSSGEAILQPGNFYFDTPESGNPCIGGESPPCFVPVGTDGVANAFRILGEFHPVSSLRFAGALLDVNSFATKVDAIATLVPRHGCFVVDISGSMDNDTHKSKLPTYSYSDRFAFLLREFPSDDPDNPALPANALVHDAEFEAFELSPFQTRPDGNVAGTQHFIDGYSRRATFSNADYNSTIHQDHHPAPTDQGGLYSIPQSYNYRIETDRWSNYAGPEPLGIALRGINRAIQTFKSRKVVGDKACIIFHDQTLQWSRIFSLTDDFDYLEKFTEIDTMNDPTRGFELMVKHKIFPEAFSRTDLKLALTEALRQLASQSSTSVPSSDFIVLIGDGQTNCTSCPNFAAADANSDGRINSSDFIIARDCYYGNRTFAQCGFMDSNSNGNVKWDWEDYNTYIDWMTSCAASPGCSNELGYHELSMREVQTFVETQIAPVKIPIHVMLIGAESGPNTVDVADPDSPGKCLSDIEKRQERNKPGMGNAYPSVSGPEVDCLYVPPGIMYTTSFSTVGPAFHCTSPQQGYNPRTAWNSKSGTNPYTPVNTSFYNLATMTGGLWSPIRPSPSNCTVQECIPGQVRFTDPMCRSPQEQVFSAMDQILGQNPFTLVVSDRNF